MEAVYWTIVTDAPARLKKELDTVLTLQTELDSSEWALQNVWTIVEKGQVSQDAWDALASLEHGHERLLDKVDALYSSLNIQDRFPELDGINFQFVQTLLLAQDTKDGVAVTSVALGMWLPSSSQGGPPLATTHGMDEAVNKVSVVLTVGMDAG